jgi:hypothetical protein
MSGQEDLILIAEDANAERECVAVDKRSALGARQQYRVPGGGWGEKEGPAMRAEAFKKRRETCRGFCRSGARAIVQRENHPTVVGFDPKTRHLPHAFVVTNRALMP